MSIVPYNANNEIVYHDPRHGILVLHNSQQNTLELLSTNGRHDSGFINSEKKYSYSGEYRSSFDGNNDSNRKQIECPACGFAWQDIGRDPEGTMRGRINSFTSNSSSFDRNRFWPTRNMEFRHHNYFKLLGDIPYSQEEKYDNRTLPNDIFNQGYFERFFKKVPPFELGSGAHSQVYKVVHVLNNIQLGCYALKRISIGDKYKHLRQVLNEVLILYELSAKGANENNLITYNHVWLELGDIDDSSVFVLPNCELPSEKNRTKIPYVYILQQYCAGGHLEDLINKNFQPQKSFSTKEKVEVERFRRRKSRKGHKAENDETSKWLSQFEIWKFFRDVAIGVNYLHSHGILHRDLKPSNCLLDSIFNKKTKIPIPFKDNYELEEYVSILPKVLVSDFGEGKFVDKRNSPLSSGLKDERRGNTGTLEFTAPELWLFSSINSSLSTDGEEAIMNDFTYDSDIYSLGLILCWLCVGKLPFAEIIQSQDDPEKVREEISTWYFNLTWDNFITWFRSLHLRENCSNFEISESFGKLIYAMIKGSDFTTSPNNKTLQRMSISHVLDELSNLKWAYFIQAPSEENNSRVIRDYPFRQMEGVRSAEYLQVPPNEKKDDHDDEDSILEKDIIDITKPEPISHFSESKLSAEITLPHRAIRVTRLVDMFFMIGYVIEILSLDLTRECGMKRFYQRLIVILGLVSEIFLGLSVLCRGCIFSVISLLIFVTMFYI